jgi:hypothetical protein
MFNLRDFIVRNIVNGVKNGTFTKEYANIMAVNYLVKGVLTEEHVIDIDTQITAWEAEQATVEEPVGDPIEEPVEETIEESTEIENTQAEAGE